MENLNEKYSVTRENFITFINRLCNKRSIIFQLTNEDTDFTIIKKLNKILLNLKLKKMLLGFNILDEDIQNLIALNKETLKQEDLEKLYIYFYFYNSINDLNEVPSILNDPRVKWQIIKQINSDYKLDKRYTYINGEILLNKS